MQIHKNFDLTGYHTFHCAVTAENAVFVNSVEQLKEALNVVPKPHLILGGGSNVLFREKTYEGTVIFIRLKGIETITENDDTLRVTVAAGENWDDFVNYTVENGLYGIENLSLIPGLTGASPIQNIGAYGQEVSNTITSVEYLELSSGEVKVLTNYECQFGYRESIFKRELHNSAIITRVTFTLHRRGEFNLSYSALREFVENNSSQKPTLKEMRRYIIAIRRSKLPDPDLFGNAGSFFKNPVITEEHKALIESRFGTSPAFAIESNRYKMPAGWLMEKCGWKGKRKGDAGFFEKQALSLVNYGNATPKELIAMFMNAQNDVAEKTGIFLTPEVNLV